MSSSTDNAIIVNQLPLTVEFPKDQENFLDTLTNWSRSVGNTVNTKTGGLFTLQEQYSSNQYFTLSDSTVFRNVYRKTFDMVSLNLGPIAPGATVAVPHNIVVPATIANLNGTDIWGSATNSDAVPRRMPLPYASSTVTRIIELYFDATNVVLINGTTQTALTYCTVVLEYIKN